MTDIPRIGCRVPKRDDGVTLIEVKRSKCKHVRFLVDEKLDQVECADCGEKLNPIWVLNQMAKQESLVSQRVSKLRALAKQLSGKLKYKCRHCGKMNDMARIVRLKREYEIEEFMQK